MNFGERSARKVQELTKGEVPDVESMWRALDLEGEEVAEERAGNVGSRHRSAYRLCGALPGSVAVVISQDGSVHFVCQRGGSRHVLGAGVNPPPSFEGQGGNPAHR